MTIQTKNRLSVESIKNKINYENALLSKPRKRKKTKTRTKINIPTNAGKFDSNELQKNLSNEKVNNLKGNNIELSSNNINMLSSKDEIGNKKEKGIEKEKEKRKIIKKIKTSKMCIYLCFLCVRKRKNIQNILLDEGMKVITEKLDIMNLFKNLYRN